MTDARDMSPKQYAEARRTRAWRNPDADAPKVPPVRAMTAEEYQRARRTHAWRAPQPKGDD